MFHIFRRYGSSCQTFVKGRVNILRFRAYDMSVKTLWFRCITIARTKCCGCMSRPIFFSLVVFYLIKKYRQNRSRKQLMKSLIKYSNQEHYQDIDFWILYPTFLDQAPHTVFKIHILKKNRKKTYTNGIVVIFGAFYVVISIHFN